MKIAFLSTHHGTGASETLWIETAAYLKKAGHEVSAAAAWRKREAMRLKPLHEVGVPCIFLRLFSGNQIGPKLIRRLLPTGAWELSRFRNWLRKQQPDLLVVSEGNDISALPFLENAVKAGVPFSVVTHGLNPADWPEDDLADRMRLVFTQARQTCWVSARNIEEFQNHIGADLPNAFVVRNPVKVAREAVFSWPKSNSPWRMACVARMQTRPKGHDLLLQALAQPVWKDRDLKLTFFGTGENRRGMERMAQRLNLDKQVHFCGHVSDLNEIWCDHHILAQPSRNEGMPLSLVEALFFGRPALVTDVAGHAELVTEGENGFIAEAATVRHISQALERAWQQRNNWQEMGISAYERIRRDVSTDPVADYARLILEAAKP